MDLRVLIRCTAFLFLAAAPGLTEGQVCMNTIQLRNQMDRMQELFKLQGPSTFTRTFYPYRRP